MPVLPNAKSIQYELQSLMDLSRIADMSFFPGGTVTLQRENPFSELFSAVISDIAPTEGPSHGVTNVTDLHISNAGTFPQLNNKHGPSRILHTVTFAGLQPTQRVARIEPSGMETVLREGEHFQKTWVIGTFKPRVVHATYTKGTEEKEMKTFDDPAWTDLKVDISASVSVKVGDVVSFTNDKPGTDYSCIVVADQGVELQKMVEDLVN